MFISKHNILPKKGTQYAAGVDIPSFETLTIKAGTRQLVSSGLTIETCPKNCYLRVAPRSGLSLKGIDVGAGVIDRDYIGDIKVLLINNSNLDFEITNGNYIAQLIPEKVSKYDILVNNCIIENKMEERKEKGFGASDKNS